MAREKNKLNRNFSLILCLLGLFFYAGAMYVLLKGASAPAEGKKIAADGGGVLQWVANFAGGRRNSLKACRWREVARRLLSLLPSEGSLSGKLYGLCMNKHSILLLCKVD